MDPATMILLLNAGLTLVEQYGPKLAELLKKGEITADEQAALKKRIDALREHQAFSGPEWAV